MHTRAEWESEADRWLLTARKYAVHGGALICPPGPPSQSGPLSDGIEGFARSFLIAGAYLGGGATDRHGHAEFYADGLAAAMNSLWPRAVGFEDWPHAGITQPAVEAANLAFGLALCRPQFWDQLPDSVRERLASWLAHHARLRLWQHNNWLLFPAVIEAFLESVGYPVDGGHGAENVERVESWYLGDGWYNDGPPAAPGRNLDHYNSWVFQPFLWQWYLLRGDAEPQWRVERFRARLAEFAASYALTFADDGAPLHMGRSLAYRHAVLGGLWTAALADVAPSPAAIRRIAGRTLDYFRRLGVDGSEPPSLGWGAREFLPAVQEYSGPGSAYFAGMGFLGLAAPASHPLWTADEELSQPTASPTVTILPALSWAVQHGRPDGIVRVVNHGSDHANHADDPGDPHYAKFAYSTRTAPGTGAAWSDRAWATGIDGHAALVDEWGRATRRGRIMGSVAGEGYVASWHAPRLGTSGRELPGARIVTASLVTGECEVRCHLVTAPEGWSLREGGHAVASDAEVASGHDSATAWALGHDDATASAVGDDGATASAVSHAAATAWAVGDGVRSLVVGLFGYESGAVARYEDANAFGRHSAAPYLSARLSSAESVHVALHILDTGSRADLVTVVDVEVSGTHVTARWASGGSVAVDLASLFGHA